MDNTFTQRGAPRPLSELLEDAGAWPLEQSLRLVHRLGFQVRALHEDGRTHRSIDIHTVTVDDQLQPTLAAGPPKRRFGGTDSDPEFCPPELADGDGLELPESIDAAARLLTAHGHAFDPRRIDIYQLGTLLCRLLLGEPVHAYMFRPKVKSQLPSVAQSLLEQMLGHDPATRLPDCESLLAAMGGVLTNLAPDAIPSVNETPPRGSIIAGMAANTPPLGHGPIPAPVNGKGKEALPFARLGHFRILCRIGRGGMGDVYRGYDDTLDRPVAVKVLPSELARDEDFVRRFHAEATAAAKIAHPNVVPIYFIGEDRGCHFFAMQLVDGESLAARLERQKRLPVGDAIRLIEQCLAGLEAAHNAGLIHRDIKPANILLDGVTGRALLVDFGLARRMGQSERLTATGVIMGTVDYIAPEQARGHAVDGRADLYALGVLFSQCRGPRRIRHDGVRPAECSDEHPQGPRAGSRQANNGAGGAIRADSLSSLCPQGGQGTSAVGGTGRRPGRGRRGPLPDPSPGRQEKVGRVRRVARQGRSRAATARGGGPLRRSRTAVGDHQPDRQADRALEPRHLRARAIRSPAEHADRGLHPPDRHGLAERRHRIKPPERGTADSIHQIAMGWASAGPLFVYLPGQKRTWALDLNSMKTMEVHWSHWGSRNAYGPLNMRVSPDGTMLIGWGGGWAGCEAATFSGGLQTGLHGIGPLCALNGTFALPSADARYIYTSQGITNRGFGPLNGPLGSIVPAVEPGYFLSLRPAPRNARTGSEAAVYTEDRKLLFFLKDLDELQTMAGLPWEKRVYYYPRAGLLVTLGAEKDRLLLRRVDLLEQLEKSDTDFQVVLSQPPAATAGAAFSYRLDVRSKKGGATVKLESGPPGLTVTPQGQVRWDVPANPAEPEAEVLVTIRDASGAETQHTFTIRILTGGTL
ncbi:MAG: protein kinase domain-containing protein [Thermoguttaceae bacterium]